MIRISEEGFAMLERELQAKHREVEQWQAERNVAVSDRDAWQAEAARQGNVIRSLTSERNELVKELKALRSWLAALKCDCDTQDRTDEVNADDPAAHRDYCSYRNGYESCTQTRIDDVRSLTE